MKVKSLDNRGQSAWFDIIIIFLCITIFTAGIWAFTLGGKAAGTQAQRSGQDFTNSLLLSILYDTLDSDNDKLRGKSISDVIGMYFANKDKVTEEFVIDSLEYVKIHEYLEDKGLDKDSGIEWFLYGEYEGTRLCIHGTNEGIEKCKEDIGTYSSRAACVEIVFPKGENEYEKVPIYLFMVKRS